MRATRFAAVLILLGLVGLAPTSMVSEATATPTPSPGTTGSVLLDCNGYGLANNPDHPSWRCPDPVGIDSDEPRFEDNEHYIGHDEPALEFFSRKAGSGNSARYEMTIPTDP